MSAHKQATVEDDTEVQKPALIDHKYGIYLQDIQDVDLQKALIKAREPIVELWEREELKGKKIKNLRQRLRADKHIAEISKQVSQRLPSDNKNKLEDITNLLKTDTYVLDYFVEYGLDKRVLELEVDPRKRRKEIKRIIKAHARGGDEYDILGIREQITHHQLQRLRHKLNFLVHPDRADDADATESTQLINDATDKLVAKKQEVYEPPLKPRNDDDDDNSDFAPGAFLSSNSDYDSSDDGNESVKSTPKIPDDVKGVHQKMQKHIKTYFSTPTEDGQGGLKGIEKHNRTIKSLNKKAKRQLDAYVVDTEVLLSFRRQQIHILNTRDNVEKLIQALYQSYEKTRLHDDRQWPASWGNVIVDAVCERLEELTGTKFADKSQLAKSSRHYSSDVDMDLPVVETASPRRLCGGVEDNHVKTVARPIKAVSPGSTLLGDKIIAYRPVKRFNRYENKFYTQSMKFFVERPGFKVFKVVSGAEVGYDAALAYDGLGQEEKNDVGRYLTDITDGKLTPDLYDGILGIGTKESEFEMTDRFPETWIHIAVKEKYGHNSNAVIINRTAFRQLVDNADKHIDSFYVNHGIQPPWSTTPYPDPRNNVRYMSLEYPGPKRKALEYPGTQIARIQPLRREAKSGEIGLLGPRNTSRPGHKEPAVVHETDQNSLVRDLKDLMVILVEQQKQQRKQQQEHEQRIESILARFVDVQR